MPRHSPTPTGDDHNRSHDMANSSAAEARSQQQRLQETRSYSHASGDPPREDSPPPSGTQTPAACRPLLRRSQGIHTEPNIHLSHLGQLHEHKILEDSVRSLGTHDRVASYNGLSHLQNVQEEYEDDAFIPKPTKHGPSAVAPTIRQRPAPLLRRVSYEVMDREQSLRREIEALRGRLNDQEAQHAEDKKKQESMMVEFAMNRMLEMQQTQMKVQQKLLEKMGAMDLRGQGVPKTFSRRGSKSSDDELSEWEREWKRYGTE